MAVQGIGNRATDEGKEALDAAKAVADGADPAETFEPLASKYGNSAMAFAYHTRAGSEGPGGMVGSGVGALFAGGALGYAMMSGQRNDTLADDLGVKPEDPEPETEIKTTPKQPVHKTTDDPKKDEPKKDPKKDEPKKDEPKKDEPKKDEPKKDPKKDEPKKDPVVEPDHPKPPVPTPTPKTKPKQQPRRLGPGGRPVRPPRKK